MFISKGLRNNVLACVLAGAFVFPSVTFAASYSDSDIDAQIAEQQQRLNELNARKKSQNSDKLARQIEDLQAELRVLKSTKDNDVDDAIESLTERINDLQDQIDRQNELNERILQVIERLENLAEERAVMVSDEAYSAPSTEPKLINPGPREPGSYTQDASAFKDNSTTVFSYHPNQLYKIYCRVGYITDLSLHKGETVNFVGGGDTSAWAINSNTVDGVPHIYIKPTVESSTTNIIVTTNKRSYQLIVSTSDWYNPMVTWTYNEEALAEAMAKREKDKKAITGTMNGMSISDLNFNYKVTGASSNKPTMVFDDGEKTIIKYNKLPEKSPAVFIREHGRKGVSLINFKVKDNCYILDRIVDQAELRFSDKDVLSIKRK